MTVVGLHTFADPTRALNEAGAVFVGGGNTFRLLTALEDASVLRVLRERAGSDMAYIGSSAGTNLACPTIHTTNDMPIVKPSSFAALNLVPFQINPHFVGGNPFPGHRGETREERIAQFHEVATAAVVGLPEGCWLEVDRGRDLTRAVLRGSVPAMLFHRGAPPRSLPLGSVLTGVGASGDVSVDPPLD